MDNDFLLNFQHTFSIDISPVPNFTTPVYTVMAAGWKDFSIDGDETTDDTAYLDGNGGKTVTVTGGMVTFEFTGDYDSSNAIHQFVMSKFGSYGKTRVVSFMWELPAADGFTSGRVLSGPATIHNISPSSGDADGKSEISLSISFNGNPTIVEPVVTI